MNTTKDIINKHKKPVLARLDEWLDNNDFTNDGKRLILFRIYENSSKSRKVVNESISKTELWSSLDHVKKSNLEYNEYMLNDMLHHAKNKFNESIDAYPILFNYEYELLNALIAEAKLDKNEQKAIISAFVASNVDVNTDHYVSGITKLYESISNIEAVEPFDFELFATIFEESDSILGDMQLVKEETSQEKLDREKEQAKQQEKNKAEFAQANLDRTKAKNAPLAKAMRTQGLSQDDAADMLDVDKSTISRLKTGVRKPSFALLKKLARKFGDIESLFPALG